MCPNKGKYKPTSASLSLNFNHSHLIFEVDLMKYCKGGITCPANMQCAGDLFCLRE